MMDQGDIPFLLEEFPGKGNVSLFLAQTLKTGGAGALIWNLSPGIDEHTPSWQEERAKLREIRAFSDVLSAEN